MRVSGISDLNSLSHFRLKYKTECVSEYSRLSLSRSPRDFLKYFEISVSRHIRFAELRKKDKSNNHISQMNM